jgi:UDP-N-acetylmuramyl tripeptide synthase
VFLINDNFADGRDVSWLWDVALEELHGCWHQYWSSGIRAQDMALRLKYADLDYEGVNENVSETINNFIAQLSEDETGYLIPTYTAMREVRKVLGTKTLVSEDWL